MSRGLGPLQERLLEALADGRLYTSNTLAVLVYGIEPSADGLAYVTEAQSVAIRRALNGLMKRKRVCHEGYRLLGDTVTKLWHIDEHGTCSPPMSLQAWARKIGVSKSTMHRAVKAVR
jgi:hypothetical protein